MFRDAIFRGNVDGTVQVISPIASSGSYSRMSLGLPFIKNPMLYFDWGCHSFASWTLAYYMLLHIGDSKNIGAESVLLENQVVVKLVAKQPFTITFKYIELWRANQKISPFCV